MPVVFLGKKRITKLQRTRGADGWTGGKESNYINANHLINSWALLRGLWPDREGEKGVSSEDKQNNGGTHQGKEPRRPRMVANTFQGGGRQGLRVQSRGK